MDIEAQFDENGPFEVLMPRNQIAPVIFGSPHSGSVYPKDFLEQSRLSYPDIRHSEDAFVDELFIEAPELGCPFVRAHFPRAYLDVNREPYELDPNMFDSPLPGYANVRSIRVAGGLGTIARIVSETTEIYDKRLSVTDALNRIEQLYMPYHDRLRSLMADTHTEFGCAILIDCHSMPSSVRSGDLRVRPDFVVGDRYGTSCCRVLVDRTMKALSRMGYSVTRNKPYAGGFITENYGRPGKGLHAMQIEINRALYMNEESVEKTEGFEKLKADISSLIRDLTTLPLRHFVVHEAAAE